MVYGDPYLIGKEAQYRRQAAEQVAQQRRLAKMARRRSPARLPAWGRVVGLVNTELPRVRGWLSRISETQEQGC